MMRFTSSQVRGTRLAGDPGHVIPGAHGELGDLERHADDRHRARELPAVVQLVGELASSWSPAVKVVAEPDSLTVSAVRGVLVPRRVPHAAVLEAGGVLLVAGVGQLAHDDGGGEVVGVVVDRGLPAPE